MTFNVVIATNFSDQFELGTRQNAKITVRLATDTLDGSVRLATTAEQAAGTSTTTAATPKGVADKITAAIAAIPGDRYLTGLYSYNATTNIMTFTLSDNSHVDVDMTGLVNDAVASIGQSVIDNVALALQYRNDAQTAATASAASLTDFKTRYLGSFATDPTVDGNGNALVGGALYYKTATSKLRVYTVGPGWVDTDASAQAAVAIVLAAQTPAFAFSTTTVDADPGNGVVRFNNTTLASVTFLYFDNLDNAANTVTGWLDTMANKGIITVTPVATPGARLMFKITGGVIDGSGYRKVPVTFLSGSALPTNTAVLAFTFNAAGVDGAAGTSTAATVRAIVTSNINLANGLVVGVTIDGVVLALNDPVMLNGQSAPAENGLYPTVASGATTRLTGFTTWSSYPGAQIVVQEGTLYHDTLWICTSDKGGTLGTTAIAFALIASAVAPPALDRSRKPANTAFVNDLVEADIAVIRRRLEYKEMLGRVSTRRSKAKFFADSVGGSSAFDGRSSGYAKRTLADVLTDITVDASDSFVGVFASDAAADLLVAAKGITKSRGTWFWQTANAVRRYWTGSAWADSPIGRRSIPPKSAIIALRADSVFNDATLYSPLGISEIVGHGNGLPPFIDCAPAVDKAGWTLTAGQTKTYQRTVTREAFVAGTLSNAPTPVAWASSTAYTVGAYVAYLGQNYVCLTNHTSGVGTPGFQADLAATKWVAQTITTAPVAWVTATAYTAVTSTAPGSYVTSGGVNYLCVASHTSAAAFATDLTASRWVAVSMAMSYPNTPYFQAWQVDAIANANTFDQAGIYRRPVRVTSIALCEATAGTVFFATPSGTSTLVYIHPYGDQDPTQGGSDFIKIGQIRGGIAGADFDNTWNENPLFDELTLEGIMTGGGVDGHGSIVGGNDVTFRRVGAFDGGYHNIIIKSGYIEDIVCCGNDPVLGGIMLTFYRAWYADKAEVRGKNIFLIQPDGTVSANGTIYCHSSDGTDFKAVRLDRVVFVNMTVGSMLTLRFEKNDWMFLSSFGKSLAGTVIAGQSIRPYDNIQRPIVWAQLATGGFLFQRPGQTVDTGGTPYPGGSTSNTQIVQHGVFNALAGGGNPNGIAINEQCTFTIANNLIINSGTGVCFGLAMTWSNAVTSAVTPITYGATSTFKNNIVIRNTATVNLPMRDMDNAAVPGANIDYNVYIQLFGQSMYIQARNPNVFLGFTTDVQFQALKTSQAAAFNGTDAHSVIIDAIGADKLFLNGVTGLLAGDCRLNPDCDLRFTDGQRIVDLAGPRYHLDWDSDMILPGAPAFIPKSPGSGSVSTTANRYQAAKYLQAPSMWDWKNGVSLLDSGLGLG